MPTKSGAANRKVTDEEVIKAYKSLPGSKAVADFFGMTRRAVQGRRRRVEERFNITLGEHIRPDSKIVAERQKHLTEYKARLHWKITDGIVLVGSDAHYFPGYISTAHKGFLHLIKKLRPTAIIMNGDMLDGTSISRWPRIGWEHRPTVRQEMEVVKERLGEIEKLAPNTLKAWTLGNHDARYELRLANEVPEYEGMQGFTLKEHFPTWLPAWSVWINDEVVVKHRYKSGIHATRNNALNAGKTIITGHLHSLKVTPLTDYNATRFGVDCGTMADVYGPQFEGYMEDNARDWRSGFVVLTFRKGRLCWPEIVAVLDEDHIEYRTEAIKV